MNIYPRIYHTQISTGTKHVWQTDGKYLPSEVQFIPNPMPIGEDDGVIISLCSPFSVDEPELRYKKKNKIKENIIC